MFLANEFILHYRRNNDKLVYHLLIDLKPPFRDRARQQRKSVENPGSFFFNDLED